MKPANSPRPPRWASKLLEWYCPPDSLEEVQGDLEELYAYWIVTDGKRSANRKYIFNAIRLLQLFNRKPKSSDSPHLVSTAMLHHYFTVAMRNVTRQKAFAAINIAGLALGMTCSLLIFLWVQDERSINNLHINGEQLFSVYVRRYMDGRIEAARYTPGPLSDKIKEVIPEVKYAVGCGIGGNRIFRVEDRIYKMQGGYAGSDFFHMFTYPLLQGTPQTALNSPNSLAISRKMANIFFGSPQAAMGKIMRLDTNKELIVTAVFENQPANVSEQFDYLINYDTWMEEAPSLKRWDGYAPYTYIQLHPEADPQQAEAKVKHLLDTYLDQSNGQVELGLQPYKEMYLRANFENGEPGGGRIEYIRVFSGIAIFVLLIACVNFMNLATARSTKRAKEIGIRKVVGAGRQILTGQFIGEALLCSLFAMVVSVGLVALLLPPFSDLTGKQIQLPIHQVPFWSAVISLMGITALVAGTYPAFFLASLQPVKVLKGTIKFSSCALWLRKGLVVFQFVLSIILIIVALVVSRQTEYIQTKHLGFDRKNLLYIPMEGDLAAKYTVFKQEVSTKPGIQWIDRTGNLPINMRTSNMSVEWEGKAPGTTVVFAPSRVGYDYVKVMDLEVIKGRDFSRELKTDTANYLVNEEAVAQMGFADPIGKWISLNGVKGQIIGVLKNFHYYSLHEPIHPLVVGLNEQLPFGVVLVRTKPGKLKEALASLQEVYGKINPNYPFTPSFVEEEYQRLYKSEQTITKLSNAFGFVAICIACLGLLGLAMFSAEQRTKEIGIRKVLGASAANVVILLTTDLLRLVSVSFIIAAPLAWYAMSKWLQTYAYRIDLAWWMFALAGMTTLFIAFASIGFQAVKAAVVNPVRSLRNE